MNKKIFAIIFSALLLCSCGNGNAGEQPEAASESVTAASEATVTTTSAETTAEAVSEETEIVTEVSAAEEKTPITRDFFNDDVVFEEVLLPVKITHYEGKSVDRVYIWEYDAAGNIITYLNQDTYEYDYNPDGTYNSVTNYYLGSFPSKYLYDENGYCIENTYSNTRTPTDYKTINYEYEFDEAGRLIRKTEIQGDAKKEFEYTYDEKGRLYKESGFYKEFGLDDYIYRHEYDGNIESIYCFRDDFEEEKLWKIIEKDENGNVIKETVNEGADLGEYRGKTVVEYQYDTLNRLICKNQIVSDDYYYGFYDEKKRNYTLTCEYEGDNLKKVTNTDYDCIMEIFYDENDRIIKKTYTYSNEEEIEEYFYNDDGTLLVQYRNMNGSLRSEKEYAMIPKIKTNIEYKEFYEVKP